MRKDGWMAYVAGIFICPGSRQPMQQVLQVEAIAGVGLKGDRYGDLQSGTYTPKSTKIRHATLIFMSDINAVNKEYSTDWTAQLTRRNFLIAGYGIDTASPIDTEFYLGGVRMKIVQPCDPCSLPSQVSGIPDFKRMFESRGGWRVEILSSGLITAGERMILAS